MGTTRRLPGTLAMHEHCACVMFICMCTAPPIRLHGCAVCMRHMDVRAMCIRAWKAQLSLAFWLSDASLLPKEKKDFAVPIGPEPAGRNGTAVWGMGRRCGVCDGRYSIQRGVVTI